MGAEGSSALEWRRILLAWFGLWHNRKFQEPVRYLNQIKYFLDDISQHTYLVQVTASETLLCPPDFLLDSMPPIYCFS